MKGRKHHKEAGGVNEAEADLKDKPEERVNAKKIFGEADAKKHGGRTKRKHGGSCKCHKCMGGGREAHAHGGVAHHHEKMEDLDHAKHLGKVHGERKVHAGRKPRKSGGRAGSDSNPFSSAKGGESPSGHKTEALTKE